MGNYIEKYNGGYQLQVGGNKVAITADVNGIVTIPNVPAGNIAATTMQDAINELDTEKLSKAEILGAIGNINNPLLDMPLKNSLAMKVGVGSTTFTRASTATYVDRYGMLKTAAIDEPRFEKEGYLNEGVSTNLLTYSETFTGWGFNACSQSNDATTYNPYGVLGFSKFTASGANAWFSVTDGTLTKPTPTVPITISFFIKEGTTTRIRLRVTEGGAFQNDVVINIADGTEVIEALTFSVSINYLANGIKRIKATYTPTITHTAFGLRFYMQNNSGDSIAGDYMWFSCAQIEALPFATSYIPTTSATVTRSADMLYVTRANNFPDAQSNAEGFSVAYDMNSIGQNSATSQQYAWSMYVTSTDTIGVIVFGTSAIRQIVISSSANTINSYSTTNFKKRRVISTASNSILKLYIDGVLGDTDTNTTGRLTDTANSLTNIRIGGVSTGTSSNFNGHISNFRIYDKVLSAQEVALA